MNIGMCDLEQKAKYFNDLDAQLELGRRYRDGVEVEMDLDVARDWFEKAARQGNSEARNCLASMDGQVMNVEPLEKQGESTPHKMREEPAPVKTTVPTEETTALLMEQRSFLLKFLRRRLDLPRVAVPLVGSAPDEGDRPIAKLPHSKSPFRPRRKKRLQKQDVESATPATGVPGTRWSLASYALMALVWVFWNWVNDDLREQTAEKLAFEFQRAGKPAPWISADEPLNKGEEKELAEPLAPEKENEATIEEQERGEERGN